MDKKATTKRNNNEASHSHRHVGNGHPANQWHHYVRGDLNKYKVPQRNERSPSQEETDLIASRAYFQKKFNGTTEASTKQLPPKPTKREESKNVKPPEDTPKASITPSQQKKGGFDQMLQQQQLFKAQTEPTIPVTMPALTQPQQQQPVKAETTQSFPKKSANNNNRQGEKSEVLPPAPENSQAEEQKPKAPPKRNSKRLSSSKGKNIDQPSPKPASTNLTTTSTVESPQEEVNVDKTPLKDEESPKLFGKNEEAKVTKRPARKSKSKTKAAPKPRPSEVSESDVNSKRDRSSKEEERQALSQEDPPKSARRQSLRAGDDNDNRPKLTTGGKIRRRSTGSSSKGSKVPEPPKAGNPPEKPATAKGTTNKTMEPVESKVRIHPDHVGKDENKKSSKEQSRRKTPFHPKTKDNEAKRKFKNCQNCGGLGEALYKLYKDHDCGEEEKPKGEKIPMTYVKKLRQKKAILKRTEPILKCPLKPDVPDCPCKSPLKINIS